MTKDRERFVRSLTDDWAAQRSVSDMIASGAEAARGRITGLDLASEEISFLFTVMFERLSDRSVSEGIKQGREVEARENPLLRAAGEVVASARAAERRHVLQIVRETFDALAGTGKVNAFFAFNQALDAAGVVPEATETTGRGNTR